MSGTFNLQPRTHESASLRFIRLRQELNRLLPLDEVYFEEVRRHVGTTAAHIYGGLVATVTTFCEDHGIPCGVYTVQQIKKRATGKGGGKFTSKEKMLEAAQAKWPSQGVLDDNQADALFLLDLAMSENRLRTATG